MEPTTPKRSRRSFRCRPATSAAHAREIVLQTFSSGIPASCGIVSVTNTAPPPAARWRPSSRSIFSARAWRTFAAQTGHAVMDPYVTRPRKRAEPSAARATTGDGASRMGPQRLTRCWSGGSMAHRCARETAARVAAGLLNVAGEAAVPIVGGFAKGRTRASRSRRAARFDGLDGNADVFTA
jgi:hypothetical protein